ncbi:PQQ-like beta-propeller repeat protein [Ovoidimarina sediminis]|uniref:PQQ-like beta-propeller repeat protein n=1 Tax=Ovoidimarina sediminis TaxID=3079856 RepID=UPI002906CBB0|nr:PQQ-binding-like beta-propeller repeat protein [Rhodophyticola sp. MJ-SS7]MDU8943232.1 PQQ-binding-like beta-propeller repeat protein [Rhodophyticola sp. MJ-SS7]
MIRTGAVFTGLCALFLVSACGQDEILPGERLDLRAPLSDEAAAALPPEPEALGPQPFNAPATQNLAEWTHRGGNPQKALSHLALGPTPSLVWSARIGEGDNRRQRITADPVSANGRIFVMDAASTVSAVSTSGAVLWSTDVVPASERDRDASSGGLATDGRRVFATSGFGRLSAIDAETGALLWEQRLGAAATSAPTVEGDTVYAISTDSRGWAIDAETGQIKWEVVNAESPSGVLGAGAPSVSDRLVLLPFHTGDLVGVLKLSGLRVWTAPLSGGREGRVYAKITDVTGDPVVIGDRVYAGNPSGRSMALDIGSGERLWTAEDGAQSPLWVAGGSAFLVSDQNELVRLDADTGARIWATELPYFVQRRERRQNAITDHYGPVLAGGRLVVASGDGLLRFFDPATGLLTREVEIPGGAAALPIIVNGTLYIVSSRGQLLAYR